MSKLIKYFVLLNFSILLVFYFFHHSENHFIDKNPVSVVSIYFSLDKKAKHSAESYKKRNDNFLKSVSAPLIIFCDDKSFAALQQAREGRPSIFYKFANIWQALKELEKERNKSYVENYQKKQWHLDPEKNIHSPDLYAIWNLKIYFTLLAARRNPFNSRFFIYSDSGAWRGNRFSDWPDKNFTMKLANMRPYLTWASQSFQWKFKLW